MYGWAGMIDPDTPKALRAIASMMRMEGYRTDATGVEALVLDNAADEIEVLCMERTQLLAELAALNNQLI